ncbi:hypothetical protein G647_00366 [Cladophialophora carrionii CBS 160.54]|uniref:Uncharacterized protein n=1 Tax=Cladophialophora carrionii CBS 160.54 TaxID=1279043 RepID=V9DPP2_9EURO|nr:uncharacterized protein G647_00366 [Cladophialophora carrionii CBS 160.54]ETI27917.1 hypothetical protein G647_00366 [Cladophialophora carrionii CBS 160.54]
MSSSTDTPANTRGDAKSSKEENKQPPSATCTRIVAWGTTTGKLYLDDARLGDAKTRSNVWEHLFGKAGDRNQDQDHGGQSATVAERPPTGKDK